MKKLISFLVICIITHGAYSLNLYSIANGNWSSGGVWSLAHDGPPCNCTPSSADNITINHNINLTMHLINQGSSQNGITGVLTINAGASLTGNYDVDIRSSGSLILCGTLDIRNMIFSNGSSVNVCPTGNLVINGTFENKNSSNNVIIDGNMTVNGSFTNGNGGIIGGLGTIIITNGPTENPGNTFGCTGMDPCTSYPCNVVPCNILPIQLVNFNAIPKPSFVELEWTTATEKNNDYFTIEKSLDGIEYITVLIQKGAGNSEVMKKYRAIDNSPFGGVSYYRLKQTDYDGQFTYSAPVAVKIASRNNFQFIPNPSNGHNMVMVIPPSAHPDFSITIRDIAGRAISQRTENLNSKTRTTLLLDPNNMLKEGIYLVSITLGEEIFTEKVIISL